ASMPPEAAVISTVIFCRAWISGRVSHFTFIPVSDSNSGMFFSSTSMNGCLVRSRNSSLPWKRFQLKPCARAGVKTNGPAAAPSAAACRKVRRVTPRAVIASLLAELLQGELVDHLQRAVGGRCAGLAHDEALALALEQLELHHAAGLAIGSHEAVEVPPRMREVFRAL